MRGKRKFQLTEHKSIQLKLRNALEKGEITNDLVERRNLVSMTMTGWCTVKKIQGPHNYLYELLLEN